MHKNTSVRMRPDQQRVQTLLTDTVTLLCKNGLQYNKELKVQGLLGITLDDEEVFIVHINKVFDEVQGKVTSVQSEAASGPLMQVVNNINNLNSYSQFENVDGLSFEDEDGSESASNGMQLPVIHAQQTSILNRTNSSTGKISHRGIKRMVGAARRKDSRSVKQRLASSFRHDGHNNKEIHHMQVKKEDGFTPEYEEIHIKDEPPDQLIITDGNEIEVDDANAPSDDVQSKASVYNSASSHDSYAPSQNPLVMYESLEDCDESNSPATKSQDGEGEETVDMIECLLYNERVNQQDKGSTTQSLYKNVHISGAEESASPLDGSGTGCSAWDDTVEFSSYEKSVWLVSGMPALKCMRPYQQPNKVVNKKQFCSPLGQPPRDTRTLAPKNQAFRKQRPRRPVESAEKPFACPFEGCGLKYYRKDNMIRHHLMKHGTKLKL